MSANSSAMSSCPQLLPSDFLSHVHISGVIELAFPPPGKLRVRKIVTRSRARRTHKYPSWKMNRMTECESGTELVAARLYDFDTRVISFHEQAIVIYYWQDGEMRLHIPDFVVRRLQSTDIDEIKCISDRDDPDIQKRTTILSPLFEQFGIRYRVRFLNKDHYKPTTRYYRSVLKFGRTAISATEREQGRRFFRCQPKTTWGAVTDGCLGARGRQIAAHLLLDGTIRSSDTDRPLSPSTTLTKTQAADERNELWAA